MGTSVVNSSLEKVGVISSGVWNGSKIKLEYLDDNINNMINTINILKSENRTFAEITLSKMTYTTDDIIITSNYLNDIKSKNNRNISIGYNSFLNNTTGKYNLSFGSNTLVKNTTGNYNIGIGDKVLYNNVDSNYNIAIGSESLYKNSSDNNLSLDLNLYIIIQKVVIIYVMEIIQC